MVTYKSSSNISCHGLSDGEIDATVANGTKPYTYSWSNGQTTQNITGLPAGSYTLTVTDATSHTSSKSITIYEPDALTLSLQPSTYGGYNVSTNGGNDGAITSSVGGGSTPYDYAWSNSTTKANAEGLTAGSYTLTVTDQNGCTISRNQTMTEPSAALSITSITASNHNGHSLSCYKSSNGAITLAVAGGVTPYTFNWSNGSFSQNPTGLAAGAYQVHVTDANNTIVVGNITLTEPTDLTLQLTTSNYNGYSISCNNCYNGTITPTVTGGTASYTYAWSSGQTSAMITSLGVGNYSLTVTDANGCTTSRTTALTEPANVGWDFGGNAIDSTKFIGSTNNAPLIFKTNGVERMRVKGNGDVAINNNATVNGTLTTSNLNITNTFASAKVRTNRIAPILGDSVVYIGDSSIVFASENRIYPDSHTWAYTSNGTSSHNGRPQDLIHGISMGNSNSYAYGDYSLAMGTNVFTAMGASNSIIIGNAGTAGYFFNDRPNSLMIGFNSNIPTILVTPANGNGTTGNVGIGTSLTSNPNNYKLAVKGTIGAWELKIENTSTTWADFVFDKSYKRMTLLEKERFYKKEKHLPNIASAKEIEKHGIAVSSVMAGITQNVEENTIDIVELYKKMLELEKQNKELKKEIELLKR